MRRLVIIERLGLKYPIGVSRVSFANESQGGSLKLKTHVVFIQGV